MSSSGGGGVKDRTSEFLKEVELSDITIVGKNGKIKVTEKSHNNNNSSNKKSKIQLKSLKKKLLIKSSSTDDGSGASETEDTDLSKFLSLVAKTRQIIDEINRNGQLINTKSVVLINSPFRDEEKKKEVEGLLASMRTDTNVVNMNLNRMRQLIQTEEDQISPNSPIPNELRIRKVQYSVMLNDFKDALSSYHKESEHCRKQCLKSIQNRLSITGSTKTAEEVEDLMEKGDWSIFTEGLLMDTQMAKDQLDQLESRCKFILELETSVTELHSMFMQLGNLVETQGEIIDSIEYQVKNTYDYIDNAQNQLAAARKSKKRARRCKIITSIIVIVGVVIVGVVVFI